MMKLFLDTEFSSLLQAESKLISIGLVAEDEREFYAELPPVTYAAHCTDFVRASVIPLLWGEPYEMPPAELASALRYWLTQFALAEIVTDAPAWDFRHLRTAIDEAQGWPQNLATGAILNQPEEAWLETHFAQPGHLQHHALHDARALRLEWLGRHALSHGPSP